MPALTNDSHSDLWHGDSERDWAGHELDCCPEPRPEDVDRWRDQAARLRAEDENRAKRARAAHAGGEATR